VEDDHRYAARGAAELPIHPITIADIEHAMVVRFDIWVEHAHINALPYE
jgi:hypothetical protein